jgi:hypothetical protein
LQDRVDLFGKTAGDGVSNCVEFIAQTKGVLNLVVVGYR